ncbi:MAG: YiiD C-terminal domain-containing protein [Pseudomonadota bacterium]
MNDATMLRLTRLWHEHFPITGTMGTQATQHTGAPDWSLTTLTPLAPNTNIHGSAFAGTLYAVEALTAWGLVYLALEEAGIAASIIHAEGQIKFAQPVRSDIEVRCTYAGFGDDFARLRRDGRCKIELTSQALVAGEVVSEFNGLYPLRLERTTR